MVRWQCGHLGISVKLAARPGDASSLRELTSRVPRYDRATARGQSAGIRLVLLKPEGGRSCGVPQWLGFSLSFIVFPDGIHCPARPGAPGVACGCARTRLLGLLPRKNTRPGPWQPGKAQARLGAASGHRNQTIQVAAPLRLLVMWMTRMQPLWCRGQ